MVASHRSIRLDAQASALAARGAELETRIAGLEESLASERRGSSELSSSLATVRAENVHLLERIDSEAKRLAEMQDKMKLEFENLANRLLEEKSTKSLDQNQQHLPVLSTRSARGSENSGERMDTIHTEEEKSAAALGIQLKNLHDLNRQMAEEAENLTNALKGQSKTQGSWGELVLERILEKMRPHKGIGIRDAGFISGRRAAPAGCRMW